MCVYEMRLNKWTKKNLRPKPETTPFVLFKRKKKYSWFFVEFDLKEIKKKKTQTFVNKTNTVAKNKNKNKNLMLIV